MLTNLPDDVQKAARLARRYAERKFDGIGDGLAGMCAIGSVHLFRLLRKAGYKPKLAVANDYVASMWTHVFVILDGLILDVTATQFSKTKSATRIYDNITVLALNDVAETEHWWQDFDEYVDLRTPMRLFREWSEDQRPR